MTRCQDHIFRPNCINEAQGPLLGFHVARLRRILRLFIGVLPAKDNKKDIIFIAEAAPCFSPPTPRSAMPPRDVASASAATCSTS